MSRSAVGALAGLSRLVGGVASVLPGGAGKVARLASAGLEMAKELAALGADHDDIKHITRVQDIRQMVAQAKADKN